MAKSDYEIGAMLREARMHAQVDISEIEENTRIRAKYLRAIENEEWGLLPGPVYAKVFLRTYAEYLNLDAKRILDEYKLHYDQYDELEHQQTKQRHDSRLKLKLPGGPKRTGIVAALLLLALLFFVMRHRENNDNNSPLPAQPKAERSNNKAQKLTLRILAKQPTRLCVRNGTGTPLTNGKSLAAGEKASYRGKELLVRISDRKVRLSLNSKLIKVPTGSAPIAYNLTPVGARRVALKKVPKC